MMTINKIKEYTFSSALKETLTSFLTIKRLSGRIYNTEGYYLTLIDRFAIARNLTSNSLSKEFVEKFCAKSQFENASSCCNRTKIIKILAKFMISQDMDAFIVPYLCKSNHRFVPHIYSNIELIHMFEQSDKFQFYTNCPNRQHVASLIFRMFYSCGLRHSEALNLRIKDVDLENGVILIRNTKFNKSRYVPISPELLIRCKDYFAKVHYRQRSEYFFPAPDDGRYSASALKSMFRQLLAMAGISYNGKSPRIHDFRHTFAINCLKKWVCEDKDLYAMLPILSAYMGHVDLQGTQQYLRLTADALPHISKKLEEQYGDYLGVTNEKQL